MTSIYDNPADFAANALAGFCAAHADRVQAVPGGLVSRAANPQRRVSLVVGGGSGHFPAFAGYVGPGLAAAAVAGDVFASPSAQAVYTVARQADRGGGIVLGFGNYAGDALNFGIAAERLEAEGMPVRILAVTDDVASADPSQTHLRRGVAGDLTVFKLAGAAAEEGRDLDDVERVGRKSNARTVSFGVAFGGCTLPGAGGPLFTVPPGRMAVGLGIHGEHGIDEVPILRGAALARMMLDRLLAERPADAAGRVAVILNGLGATKYEELLGLYKHLDATMKDAGLQVVEPAVGEFMTSLDMAGLSLTLTWLDDELEALWTAPVDTPVLRRGTGLVASVPIAGVADAVPAAAIVLATEASRASAADVVACLDAVAVAMQKAEADLGQLDAYAGDGDHGQGMARGSAAAAHAAQASLEGGAGATTVLAAAGDAWADRAGGTSGALWGVALRAWSGAFSDAAAVTPETVAAGVRAALAAVLRVGKAKPGDKTLVDAAQPFVDTLTAALDHGRDLPTAWAEAAEAATEAAAATASLSPRLGRARPLAERSLGHPDPGATSLALCAQAVGEWLRT